MSDENQKDSSNNPNPAESDVKELSENELKDVSGGMDYTTMQWEYTKQDDTGAAKGTVATKVNLAKGAGAS
jgi:bacteriocin-like protein